MRESRLPNWPSALMPSHPNEAVVDWQREGPDARLTDEGARVSTERDGGKFRVLGSCLLRSEAPEPNAISSTRIMRT
jgi:hypothetical protein